MKKAVAILSEKPELKVAFDEMEVVFKQFEDRMQWIKKQALKAKEDSEAPRKALWDQITKLCLDGGLLPPDFTNEKYHFHCERDAGLLYVCDGEHGDGDAGEAKKMLEMLMSLLDK